MKKLFAMMVSVALILTVAVSPVWAVGDKVRSDKAAGPAGETGDGDRQASRGVPVGESAQLLSVQEDMTGKKSQLQGRLTALEIDHIIRIRQEEKLARDVYLTLSDLYPAAAIFYNISESEQRHMDAVKSLIVKYGLDDPVADDTIGEFPEPTTEGEIDFAQLYVDMVQRGVELCEALQVGIDIELLDIKDIEDALDYVTARDVSRVFNNLLNGSYNHWNAFESRYKANNCEQ